ncbi:MAG: chromate transporter [Roseicyclus sp.]
MPARPPMHERGITIGDLFRCFLVVGITGFGGVLPVVIHEVVRKRGWLDMHEFTEILSVCQVLPGPNIVNISVLFGARVAGIPGAVVSVGGLLLLPVALVLTLGTVYAQFADQPAVEGAVRTVAAGAAGLLIAVTARLFWPQRRNPIVLGIGLLVLLAVAWARVPLIWVVLGFAPVSLALTWWWMRRYG